MYPYKESTCRKTQSQKYYNLSGLLTSCKVSEKNIKWFTSNNHLKNPAIWLGKSFNPKKSRTRIFLDMWMVLSDSLQYGAHFRTFSAKSNEGNLKYNRKGPFLGNFRHFLPNLGKMRIFPKKRALSLLSLYESLTWCKRPEKTNERILRKVCYGNTDWETDLNALISNV